ncbi:MULTISPECIES: hypothetical protein [Bacillaceae]|uniref:hypothetical protein n=1 Tax=Bacillaceae TaxID=186817 RepID=UPI000BFCCD65|nr:MULTISPECIES: hypothetical protein [Bacillaceae]PGT81674.1 hypothetical protein COD11_16480 [Bacillus sp. AFS040349]UGB32416.1 hypothetical protein LPC09_08295 [Metabacillus sp. B2-18]
MKYFVIFMTVLICTACNTNNQDEAMNGAEVEQEQGLLQTGNDEIKRNDDLLVESREEVNLDNNDDPLHPTEAEKLVKKKIGSEHNENTIVQYDHLENGHYIIHVYSLEGEKENSEAWYMVDLKTQKVEKLQR